LWGGDEGKKTEKKKWGCQNFRAWKVFPKNLTEKKKRVKGALKDVATKI